MALTIERIQIGSFRVVFDGEIGAAQLGAVRYGLASILVERPAEVEVHVPSVLSDGAGWGLLRSFADILWGRGCRVVVIDESGSMVSLVQPASAEREPVDG